MFYREKYFIRLPLHKKTHKGRGKLVLYLVDAGCSLGRRDAKRAPKRRESAKAERLKIPQLPLLFIFMLNDNEVCCGTEYSVNSLSEIFLVLSD